MAVLGLMLQSCRNDYLNEQHEAYNNSSAFKLTSRTISLQESKHLDKLSTELQKAEQAFKTFKTNISGKVVNYGNGVSIDTDHVIYIENGSNYHTYTFKIHRENAPADAPVENLLLTPLPDGTYREFLVTYKFTQQEKQILLSGGDVNRNGKVEVTELKKGTYGNPLGKQNCGYQDVDVYFACYTGDHHAGNESTWGGCNWQSAEGGYPPVHYTVVAMVCTGDPDPIDDSTAPVGGGSTGGGGIIPNPDPQPEDPPCIVVPSTSLQTTLTDENGCAIGTPTLPNLGGNPKYTTPCEKTKSIVNNPKMQAGFNELKNQSQLPEDDPNYGERGIKFKTDGTPSATIIGEDHSVNFGDKTGYAGGYHNHTVAGIPIFSPPDIDQLLGFAKAQPTSNPSNVNNSYLGVIAPYGMHYVIWFSGTYQDAIKTFSQEDLDNYKIKCQNIHDVMLLDSQYSIDHLKLNAKGLEALFFYTLKEMGLDGKVNLQRIENNQIKNINLDNNNQPIPMDCQ